MANLIKSIYGFFHSILNCDVERWVTATGQESNEVNEWLEYEINELTMGTKNNSYYDVTCWEHLFKK